MTSNRIVQIALALAVLLALSWPAAAQQRPEATVARVDLNLTAPVTLADAAATTPAGSGEAAEVAEVESGAAEADAEAAGEAAGSSAVSSWGSRHVTATLHVKTVEPEMSELATRKPDR